ncbi:hypothetical protein GN956_G15422 [Arapaima gigas]
MHFHRNASPKDGGDAVISEKELVSMWCLAAVLPLLVIIVVLLLRRKFKKTGDLNVQSNIRNCCNSDNNPKKKKGGGIVLQNLESDELFKVLVETEESESPWNLEDLGNLENPEYDREASKVFP